MHTQFISITADNASNNLTMMEYLVAQLKCADPSGDYDKDHATIQCLAHVIHLAVMDLLGQKDVKEAPLNIAVDMDEWAAQDLGVEDPDGYGDKSDKDLWLIFNWDQADMVDMTENEVDMMKVMWKVS